MRNKEVSVPRNIKNSYKLAVIFLFLLSNQLTLSEEVKINKNETKSNVLKDLEYEDTSSSVLGKFGILGNGIGFKEQKSNLENFGKIQGGILFKAKDNNDKEDKTGAIILEGQGNGVVSIAYSPFSNKSHLNKEMVKVLNDGFISGAANLTGGNALQNGEVNTFAVGNGILAHALADYGEVKGAEGGGGDTGTVTDGVAGGSRTRIRPKAPKTTTSNRTSIITPKEVSSKPVVIDPTAKPDPADWNGKDVVIKLSNLENSGTVKGEVISRTAQGYSRGMSPVVELGGALGLDPQWRSQNIHSSGNAVAVTTYVTTPTRHTYAEDKENRALIGNINNSGSLEGKVDVLSGNEGTLTYAHAYGSGNGVSAMAYTSLFAKNKTSAEISTVNNSGNISGDVKIVAGNNSGKGYHEYSNAKSSGSGNGISTHIEARNYNLKEATSKIGEINNKGNISGKIYAKAGAGNGENMAIIEASGNGISAFGLAARKDIKIEKVDNEGIISGSAVIYGGKDSKGFAKNVDEKLFIMPVDRRAEEKITNIKFDFTRDKEQFTDKFGRNPIESLNNAKKNETINTTYKDYAINDIEKIEKSYGGAGTISKDDKVALYFKVYDLLTDKNPAEKINVTNEWLKLEEYHIKEAKREIIAKQNILNNRRKEIEDILNKYTNEQIGKGFNKILYSYDLIHKNDLKILDKKLDEANSLLLKFENERVIKANNVEKDRLNKEILAKKEKLKTRDKDVAILRSNIDDLERKAVNLNDKISKINSGEIKVGSYEREIADLKAKIENKRLAYEEENKKTADKTKLLNFYSKVKKTSFPYSVRSNSTILVSSIASYNYILKDIDKDISSNEENVNAANKIPEDMRILLNKINDATYKNRSWDNPTNYTYQYNQKLKKLRAENPVVANRVEKEYLEYMIPYYTNKLKGQGINETGVEILGIMNKYADEIVGKAEKLVNLKKEKEALNAKLIALENNASDGIDNKKIEIAKIEKQITDLNIEIKNKKEELFALSLIDTNINDLEAKIKKIDEENKNLAKNTIPKNESRGLIDDTIQTTTFVFGSGNGLSVHQEGDTGNKLGNVANGGVISGYSEVYHGYGQGRYTRVAFHQNGAGIAVRSDVDSKIVNTGLISGNNFALLAKGKKDDSESVFDPKFKSGFNGGVDNYGILAGKIIIGGYHTSALAPEDFEYFETIYTDSTKYNNYGLFVKLDDFGNPLKVIVDKTKSNAKYNDKEVINIEDMKHSYNKADSEIKDKIINGVGENGVVKIEKDKELEISNSTINSFKTGVKLEDNSALSLEKSIINTNAFGDTSAILGSDGENTLTLSNSVINGKIDLKDGKDTLVIKSNSQFNSIIDLGKGENEVIFGDKSKEEITISTLTLSDSSENITEGARPRSRRKRDVSFAEPNDIVFNGNIANAGNILVNKNTVLKANSKISGISGVAIKKGEKLVYEFLNKENQPFVDLKNGNEVVVKGKEGSLELVATGEEFLIGRAKDVLGINFVIEKEGEPKEPKTEESKEEPKTPKVEVEGPKEEPKDPKVEVERPKEEPKEPSVIVSPIEVVVTDKVVDNIIEKTKGTNRDLTEVYNALKKATASEIKLEDVFGTIKKSEVQGTLEKIVYTNPAANVLNSTLTAFSDELREVSSNKILKKGEMRAQAIRIEGRDDFKNKDVKIKSNNTIGKIEYGIDDDKTIAFNFGGGKINNRAYDRSFDVNTVSFGTSYTQKIGKIEGTIGVATKHAKAKKENIKSNNLGAYGEIKYNLSISENWTLSPKMSVVLARYDQKAIDQENVIINAKKGVYKEASTGIEISRKGNLGNGTIDLKSSIEYVMKDKDTNKLDAHFKGSNQNFTVYGDKLKDETDAKLGVSYNHVTGVFGETKVKLNFNNKKNKVFSVGLGYKF